VRPRELFNRIKRFGKRRRRTRVITKVCSQRWVPLAVSTRALQVTSQDTADITTACQAKVKGQAKVNTIRRHQPMVLTAKASVKLTVKTSVKASVKLTAKVRNLTRLTPRRQVTTTSLPIAADFPADPAEDHNQPHRACLTYLLLPSK